ncbi:hypothetical protein [Streptomyces sp. NPDC003456]|uniref:dCTP deaminase domain-containing protein n=1 Tax=Streptomyces sp. NPDC003456 TaxID=3364683 RepID=UPI0036AF10C3
MILTGPEITAAAHDGRLRITPVRHRPGQPQQLQRASGPHPDHLHEHGPGPTPPDPANATSIGSNGHILQPGDLYLSHTLAEVGSDIFVPLLLGRSSVGRLGLFVEITAPIGDIGFTASGLSCSPRSDHCAFTRT